MAFDAVAGGVYVFIEVASARGLGVGAGIAVLTLPEGPFQGAVIEAGDVAEAFGAGYLAAARCSSGRTNGRSRSMGKTGCRGLPKTG